MITREYLEELAAWRPTDHHQQMAMKSVIARGYPYYGKLKSNFKKHFRTFHNMRSRNKTDFPRTVEGFIDFILHIGEIPEGMINPTIGRFDHSKGYSKGNFQWQEFSENSSERGRRCPGDLKCTDVIKKRRHLETFLANLSEDTSVDHIKSVVGYGKRSDLYRAISNIIRIFKLKLILDKKNKIVLIGEVAESG